MTPSSKARNYSRFIPSEEIDAAAPWAFADIDAARHEKLALENEAYGQERYQAGFSEGYAQGHAQGHAEGQAQAMQEVQRQVAAFQSRQGQEALRRLEACASVFEQQLAAAEQRIAQGVLEIACSIARQVVRRELALDPKALLTVVDEALHLLSADNKPVVLRLNPADMALLEPELGTTFAAYKLTLRADPAVEPGGCLAESAGSVVDGALGKRWERAVANLGLNSPWQAPAADTEPQP